MLNSLFLQFLGAQPPAAARRFKHEPEQGEHVGNVHSRKRHPEGRDQVTGPYAAPSWVLSLHTTGRLFTARAEFPWFALIKIGYAYHSQGNTK